MGPVPWETGGLEALLDELAPPIRALGWLRMGPQKWLQTQLCPHSPEREPLRKGPFPGKEASAFLEVLELQFIFSFKAVLGQGVVAGWGFCVFVYSCVSHVCVSV